MADHTAGTDAEVRNDRYRTAITRGIAAALLLAVLSLAEYYIAINMDNPMWPMVPFMFVKGAVILDTFMHIRALRNEGAH